MFPKEIYKVASDVLKFFEKTEKDYQEQGKKNDLIKITDANNRKEDGQNENKR